MIGIVDYGMGNIQSVLNSFARAGSEARIVTSGRELAECGGIVLPGVGAFSKAMENLRNQGLVEPLKRASADGVPLMGICLGLQLLAESSEEHGSHEGLGIVPGHVRRVPVTPGHRLPHIGWNQVRIRPGADGFEGIKDGSCFYFVHSYMMECDPRYVAATTDHGCEVTAAIQARNVFATQFHPEKSQAVGLQLIRNFIGRVAARAGAGSVHAQA